LRGTKQPAPVTQETKEVKGEVAAENTNNVAAGLFGLLIVFGIPAGIIWLIIKSQKKRA
jgi:flagellar biogenesis protein FliO